MASTRRGASGRRFTSYRDIVRILMGDFMAEFEAYVQVSATTAPEHHGLAAASVTQADTTANHKNALVSGSREL